MDEAALAGNEPCLKDVNLKMNVTPETDRWRKTHYGITLNDGRFY